MESFALRWLAVLVNQRSTNGKDAVKKMEKPVANQLPVKRL
jgi:hypothetical protein